MCVCVYQKKSQGMNRQEKQHLTIANKQKGRIKKYTHNHKAQGTRHKAHGTRHKPHGTNHNANHKLQQLTELVPCPKLDPCTIASPLKIFFFPPLQFVNVTVYPAE